MAIARRRAAARRVAIPERRVGLMSRARAEARGLVTDAQRIGVGVQRRAEKVVRDLERRAERLLGSVETRAVKAIQPVLHKTFASRKEMLDLRQRMAALEQQVKALRKGATAPT